MRFKILYLVITLLGTTCFSIYGQKNLEKHVEKLLEVGKYIDAYEILISMKSDDKEFYFLKGVTEYCVNRLDDALDDLSVAYEKGFSEKELILFLAKTHHKKGEFDAAANAYKLYLNELDNDDSEREKIILAIKKCGHGRKAFFLDQKGFVENLGKVVNSQYDEYAPVLSPNFTNKYYFSSNRNGSIGGLRNKKGLKDDVYGHYSSDIYTVELANGSWIPSTGVPPLLNSARNEDIQGFSRNGQVLVFLRYGGGLPAQIVADTFSASVDAFAKPLITPLNPDLGDKDVFLVNDTTILFSSRRKGGFGGYDIYITQKSGSRWSIPENLGPQINGPYNDRSPFLTNSGNVLYFSSDRKDGQGGFDIFQAFYGVERGRWSEAENLGNPISSPGDDLFFKLSNDGKSGVLASDRKESIGGYDLFVVYLKDQVKEQLVYGPRLPFLHRADDYSGFAATEESTKNPVNTKEEPLNLVKNREMVISPLYYHQNASLLDGNNRKSLTDLLDMMIIYPELEVLFEGNSTQDGDKAYDLYFSIKRAEAAAEYLINKGVSSERIQLRGMGSNYPMVKSLNSPLAKKNNQRIDVRLLNTEKTSLAVSYNLPKVADFIKDERFTNYQKNNQGLTYRIEVARVMQMYNNPIIMQYADVMVEKKADEREYVYKVGLFKDYFSARGIKNQIIRDGFLDLTLDAYMNGNKLSESEIRELAKVYPDLNDFIKYELE